MLRRHQGKLLEVVEGIFSDEKTYSPSCQQGTKGFQLVPLKLDCPAHLIKAFLSAALGKHM